jgi:hypothetical protein
MFIGKLADNLIYLFNRECHYATILVDVVELMMCEPQDLERQNESFIVLVFRD